MNYIYKKIAIFIFFSLVMIFIIFINKNQNQEIYVDVNERIEYIDSLKSSHINNKDIIKKIFFDDVPLVFDEEKNVFFYSIMFDTSKNLNDIDIKFLSDYDVNYTIYNLDYNNNINYSIDSSKKIEMYVYNNSMYEKLEISFTYLPIININTKQNITEEKSNANLQLYNPYYDSNLEKYYNNYDIKIKIRGSLSRIYPKKSFKIILNDKKSLLGMSENFEWILDSLYSDPSRMRNMLSSQIWNDIINSETNRNTKNYLRCNYVEVYINGNYRGLYLLKEQLNENSLNLNNKILIKGNGYEKMNFSDYSISNIFSEKYINFEIKYPSSDENSFCFWYFILNKMKKYYTSIYITDSLLKMSFYQRNLMDYKLLLAFSKAADNNTIKNIYVSYDISNNKLIFIPWDLDQTFGMSWTNTNNDTYMEYNFDKYDILASNVYESFAPIFNSDLRNRYLYLRKNVLNINNVNNYLENYKRLLTESGAAQRDSERWYNYDIEYEVECIKEWTKNRIQFLNDYFNA